MAKRKVKQESELAPVEEKKPVEIDLKKPEKKRAKKGPVKFECGFALPGKSTVAFNHSYGGKVYNYSIELDNRIYVLPDNLDEENTKRYRQALTDNKFIDVTVNHGVKFDKQTGKFTYTAIHPEHTDRNPINATIALILLGDDNKPVLDKYQNQKTKQVSILNGIVKTDNKQVYNALLKAGFYEVKKEVVDES